MDGWVKNVFLQGRYRCGDASHLLLHGAKGGVTASGADRCFFFDKREGWMLRVTAYELGLPMQRSRPRGSSRSRCLAYTFLL